MTVSPLTGPVILLRAGRVIDPESGFDGIADVLVRGRTVAAVGPGLAAPDGARVVDATGLIVYFLIAGAILGL